MAEKISSTDFSRAGFARMTGRLAAVAGLGLVLAACMTQSKPVVNAVQAQPAPVSEPYQVASASVVMSDGTVIPVPRAKPATSMNSTSNVRGVAVQQDALLSGPASLVQKAATYRAFEVAIDDLGKRKYKSPRDVRSALETLRPHDPELLAEGWIANSAFLAATQPEFVSSLKAAVAHEGKASVIAKLKSGTGVWMFAGSQEARTSVVADASIDYHKLTVLGQRFLTTAVEFQRTRWGKYEAPAPFSVAPQFAAAEVGGAGFGDMLAELAGVKPAQAAVPVMQRILSLAGLIVLQESEKVSAASMTENRDLARCARFARLNLNQCLAAAHFPSEEAYCTGKHGVNEIAYCWATYLPAAAK